MRAGEGVPKAAICARSLTKAYGRVRGIADVDLDVAPGEILALVGANGAGKTTFMRIVLDFIRPTSGSVTVLGYDSVRDSVEVRRRTTYLPGELVLPRQLTGEQAYDRYAFARAAPRRARVREVAERLNLDLTRRVGDLSKGNKQKLGLVIAFAPQADLLVLDEPTSGLDPLVQRLFGELVEERAAEGAAVVLSSHVMSEVEHLATRVALLRDGKVAIVDDVEAVRSRARRRGRVRPHDAADVHAIAQALDGIAGVTDVTADRGAVSFSCSGDMDVLVKRIAGFGVAALDVTRADLEDEFFA